MDKETQEALQRLTTAHNLKSVPYEGILEDMEALTLNLAIEYPNEHITEILSDLHRLIINIKNNENKKG